MTNRINITSLLLLSATIMAGCSAMAIDKHPSCKASIHYDNLGALPKKDEALPFGSGLISFADKSQRVVAINPNGKELFFMLRGAAGPQIMQSLYQDGRWQAPIQASFSNIGINTEPSFSPDGHTLYFVSNRPPSKGTDIWKVERLNAGWSEPVRLSDAINSDGFEWHPQVTANGDLYFAAENRSDGHGDADLYVSRLVNGIYLPAENLGDQINTAAAEWDAYVDPSNHNLLFKSNRSGGYGGFDMYISTREANAWSTPRNLGPVINTADDEDSGEVTPDGRYLIFARSKLGVEWWQLYWTDISTVMPVKSNRRCR